MSMGQAVHRRVHCIENVLSDRIGVKTLRPEHLQLEDKVEQSPLHTERFRTPYREFSCFLCLCTRTSLDCTETQER